MTASAALKSPPHSTAVELIGAALPGFETLLEQAIAAVRQAVTVDGKISAARLEAGQHAAHGLSWLATYVMALREMKAYGVRLQGEDRYGATEDFCLRIGAGEYAAQIFGGIPMSQSEIVRLPAHGLSAKAIGAARSDAAEALIAQGNTPENRARLVSLFSQSQGLASVGDPGLDETLEAIRDEMRRFCAAEVTPHAHEWHLENHYIPMPVVEKMAELGVFGLTIPEEFGGMGLTKVSMCVVSEELSRGYIGVGSLGTRSEIAAELILCGGTDAQIALAAQARLWRGAAHRRLHRTQYRLRPRIPPHQGGQGGRRLQGPWQQDLDHPPRPRRYHDAAGAHRSRCGRLSRPLHADRRKAARHR